MVWLNLHREYAPTVLVSDLRQDLSQMLRDRSNQHASAVLWDPQEMVRRLEHGIGRSLHFQHALNVVPSGGNLETTRLLPGLKSGVSGAYASL